MATSGGDHIARIWDPLTGKDLAVFKAHTDIVVGVDFSPDGKSALTSGADLTAPFCDVQTGPEVRRFAGHTEEARYVVFSPDGTARLWRTNLNDTIVNADIERMFSCVQPGPSGHFDVHRSFVHARRWLVLSIENEFLVLNIVEIYVSFEVQQFMLGCL